MTDPANPEALWETCNDSAMCTHSDVNMGYSYGNPVITKRNTDGKWVVLVTSGYNNDGAGDGMGYLYELDARTGAILRKVSTGAGTPANPSGLAKINVWVDDGQVNNQARLVYGGDLEGNVWRFDLGASGSAGAITVTKIAALVDSLGNPQPITTRPELGDVLRDVNSLTATGHPVVFIGTGKFLGTTDKSNMSEQSFYAIKDVLTLTGAAASANNIRSKMLQMSIAENPDQSRVVSGGVMNWTTKSGWFVDFNVARTPGERVNIDPQLVLGALVISTNIPDDNSCTVGGYSYLYVLDFKSGAGDSGIPTNDLTVGVVVVRLPSGQLKAIITGSGGEKRTEEVSPPGGGGVRKVSWRELSLQ